MEWCNEEMYSYDDLAARQTAEEGVTSPISDDDSRLLRGGALLSDPSLIRSANRVTYGPSNRYYSLGLRPTRTIH
jgi:formylglycine-generating enzyme required for sulfatase activity